MWGWVRLAVVLISARKRSAPTTAANSGFQDLQRDLALVLQVIGQIDRRHTALTKLPVDLVSTFQGLVQAGGGIGSRHRTLVISRTISGQLRIQMRVRPPVPASLMCTNSSPSGCTS